MKMLMVIKVDTERGNAALLNGSFAETMKSTLLKTNPDSAVFTVVDGVRTGFLVFDLESVTDIPSIGEPLFIGLGAKIDLYPVMSADDLAVGLQTWQDSEND